MSLGAKAHVTDDWMRDMVKIAVSLGINPDGNTTFLRWGNPIVSTLPSGQAPPDDAYLSLTPDVARVVYEALARHYGGSPEVATLRKDYDAERSRVDRFITYLTEPTS